ncbi:hypothetical protein [Gemella cuniculi]|uniref:hypothetical protein n=1 Tax=Gemella cuniculi TaxID=150240 RepID=UPI0003F9D550|nr:hypothetical protein [Gemella cuniculi]
MADKIIQWLIGLLKAIPEDIIKTLILGFVILILRMLVDKVKFLNSKVRNIIVKIFTTNIEISTKTSFIESPDYPYIAKIKKKFAGDSNSSNNDIWEIIIIGTVIASIIVNFFKEYVEYISLFLKWFGLIPLILSITFLFIISFSKEVQKVTVKFIIVSTIVSTLTLYYGFNIKEMSVTMSPSIADAIKFFISVYKILGVSIGVIQQMLSYILLLRVVSVYIDRKNKKAVQSIRKFIAKTKQFESVYFLVFSVILFSILSYLLTLDAVIEFLLRQ